MVTFLNNLINIYLETALWLLLGLSLAAVIKGWIPESLIKRLLSGTGPGSVIRAALIGAPLPLCSCGVLPTAVGLHRSGASKPATTSFLIATPETGIDSISVTYALMGPVMAIIRPLAAITSAIISGLLVLFFDTEKATVKEEPEKPATSGCCASKSKAQATSSPDNKACAEALKQETKTTCCSSKKPEEKPEESECCATKTEPVGIGAGLRFALVDILDDIKYWMAFGLVMAAIIASLVEPGNLAEYGSGLGAMLLMLVVGLPLYICASASTPLAAALLLAGMSPGAVLVFLLVGPATNIAALGILIRELGKRAVILYLSGISLSAVSIGLLTDSLLGDRAFELAQSIHNHGNDFSPLQWIAGGLLLLLTIKPLRHRLGF
ncbi:MAG: SO_0444 family Cu/Zn efflux transporter [Pontibacterium sp.]